MHDLDNQYDCEPWPDPVDGNELVEEIFTAIERCVYLTYEQILAITYWVLHTYFIRQKSERQAFRYSPADFSDRDRSFQIYRDRS